MRYETHALNLALSVLAEIQMHSRPVEAGGPDPFEAPFDDWMWRVEVSALESSGVEADALKKVEVMVWHTSENTVQRISQLFRSSDLAPTSDTPASTGTNYFSLPPQ